MTDLSLTPSELDLPSKFTHYRPAQLEAIIHAIESEKKFIAHGLPTGSGKSLHGITSGRLIGKMVYLTGTKGLQDQVSSEFNECGLVDVRGKNNYECQVYTRGAYRRSCEYGAEKDCSHYETLGCPYTAAEQAGKKATLTCTNYAYWLAKRRYNQSVLTLDGQTVELLVCDECHEIPSELCRFLQVEISEHDWDDDLPDGDGLMDSSADTKRKYALTVAAKLSDLILVMAAADPTGYKKDDDYKHYSKLKDKFVSISKMDSNWVWQVREDRDKRRSITFDIIDPSAYSHLIWGNVPKVLLISATLRPYTLSLCGLDKKDYDFKEWPSVFPPQLGPVYHIPTVKLSYRSTDEDYDKLIQRMDEIIASRSDRKGIVHTVSYSRARQLLGKSKHRSNMFFNEGGSKASTDTVCSFRAAGPGAVLISPSFGQGWDFPGSQAEYQIIAKVPHPNTQDRVMKERCADEDYRLYLTVQSLVQMCGRGRRYPEDRCENFIVDNSVAYVLGRGKRHAPGWFKVWTQQSIPPRPPKL